MSGRRIALVPGVLALLPEYAGRVDPVAELRAACVAALAWLAEDGPVAVVADAQGLRVAQALGEAAGVSWLASLAPQPPVGGGSLAPQPPVGGGSLAPQPPVGGGSLAPQPPVGGGSLAPQPPVGGGSLAPQPPEGGGPVLVVANGSARRTEKAPGHLDERAAGFDAALGEALRRGQTSHLRGLDPELAASLLVGHVEGFTTLGSLLPEGTPAETDVDADPFGVQYWVMRWRCES